MGQKKYNYNRSKINTYIRINIVDGSSMNLSNVQESHFEHFIFNFIELYILLQQPKQSKQSENVEHSKIFDQSQIFDQAKAEVNVVNNEEEESEIQVIFMLNNTKVDYQEPLPPSNVYCPPHHMINLNLNEDDPSSDIFYILYIQ